MLNCVNFFHQALSIIIDFSPCISFILFLLLLHLVVIVLNCVNFFHQALSIIIDFSLSISFVTAKLLKSEDGNLFFAHVKTGRSGT